jgi:hypothetical protein
VDAIPAQFAAPLYCPTSMKPGPWVSLDAFHDVVGRYREAGIQQFILDRTNADDFGVLERIAIDAIPSLRAGAVVT